MRPRGKLFDGSDSLFRTQQKLLKRAGHAVWLTEFTPARLDHLGFVYRLLHTFCELDISCALVNAYPAYIAGVLSVFSTGGNVVSLLYIVRTDSPILDNIYNKVPSFQIGPFTFALTVIILCLLLLRGRDGSFATMNGGVICALSHSSRPQTICSARWTTYVLLYAINTFLPGVFLFYSLYAFSRHVLATQR